MSARVDLDKIDYKREKGKYFVVLSQLIERKRIDGIVDSFATGYSVWLPANSRIVTGKPLFTNSLERRATTLSVPPPATGRGQRAFSEHL